MKKYWLAVAVVAVALVGLIVAQEFPDADFNNVTMQGTTPLTLGNGTDRDMCVNFNDGTFNDSICWDSTLNQYLISTNGLSLIDNVPTFTFYDTDFSSSTGAGAFNVNYGDPSATDSTFIFSAIFNSASVQAWKLTSSSAGNPVYAVGKATPFMQVGYTGVNGSQFGFLINAQGYYFDDDLYVDENSPGGVFLKDSGGSCFKCSLAAANAYTVSNGTTDRAFDANATSCQVIFQATTIAAADEYLVQLRADVNWVRVSCNWNGGTTPSVTVDLEECDSAGASCQAAQTASLTCDGGGDSTTAFGGAAGSGANTDDWINLNFGTPSGTPGVLTVTVTGNLPDCELADSLGSVIADLDTLNILGTSTDRTVSCTAATCPTVSP